MYDDQTLLRQQVRELKCYCGTTYQEVAQVLNIRADSLSSWLSGKFSLKPENIRKLKKFMEEKNYERKIR